MRDVSTRQFVHDPRDHRLGCRGDRRGELLAEAEVAALDAVDDQAFRQPAEVSGHFGPNLVRYLLSQHYQCRVTMPLLRQQLQDIGRLILAECNGVAAGLWTVGDFAITVVLLFASIASLISLGYTPFLYFRF